VRNQLSPEKLAHVERLVGLVEAMERPTPTQALIDASGIEKREGLGALRMLDVEGVCHAKAGPRSQLVWHPGPRPATEEPPRQLRRRPYEILRRVLQQSSAAWLATDHLMREADFEKTEDRPLRPEKPGVYELKLPDEHNTNMRKAALGALKALLVRGKIVSRMYGRAVTWRWVAEGGQGKGVFRRDPLTAPPRKPGPRRRPMVDYGG
jgi:hypothetical protein